VREGLFQQTATCEAMSESFLQRGKVMRVRIHAFDGFKAAVRVINAAGSVVPGPEVSETAFVLPADSQQA
jgi:hypothetical protein